MSPWEHQLISERVGGKDKTELKGECSLVNSDSEPATEVMMCPVPCSRFCWVGRTSSVEMPTVSSKYDSLKAREISYDQSIAGVMWNVGEKARSNLCLPNLPDTARCPPPPCPLLPPLVRFLIFSKYFLLPIAQEPHSKPFFPNQSP